MLALLVAATLTGTPAPPPAVSLPLPALSLVRGGAGVSHVVTDRFCSLFASELTGNYFCLEGDGDQSSALALTAVGSPTAQTDALCPNGPNCASVTSRRLDTGNYYASAGVAAPSGDFSVCVVSRLDASGNLITKDDGSTARFGFQLTSANRLYAFFQGSTGLTDHTSSTAATAPGSVGFYCVTYDYVADGTSVSRLYGEGTLIGTSSTQKGPLVAGASVPWRLGANSSGFVALQNVFAVVMTEKVLSDATISAMATAVRGQLQTARGTAAAVTRTTPRGCDRASDGTTLPANAPCVKNGGVESYGQRTNLAPRSEELEQWIAIGTPTESANAAIGPSGAKTADLIGDDDTGVLEGEAHNISTTAGETYTFSCWLKAGTTSTVTLRANSGLNDCTHKVTDGWGRYSCTATETTTTTRAFYIYPGGLTAASTGNVYVDRCQIEIGSHATPYCPTASSAATCNGDAITFPKPAAANESEGCARICITPAWTGSKSLGTQLLYANAAGTARIFYRNASDASINAYNGTNVASVNAGFEAGVRKCYLTQWSASGNYLRITNLHSGATSSQAFSGFPSFDSTWNVGASSDGSNALDGVWSDLIVGSSPEACHR